MQQDCLSLVQTGGKLKQLASAPLLLQLPCHPMATLTALASGRVPTDHGELLISGASGEMKDTEMMQHLTPAAEAYSRIFKIVSGFCEQIIHCPLLQGGQALSDDIVPTTLGIDAASRPAPADPVEWQKLCCY